MTRDEAITIMQVYKEELEHRIAKIDYDVGAIDLYSIQVEAYDTAIEALSAEAVKGWIPCSERLPMMGDYVLTYRPTMGMRMVVDSYEGYYGEDDNEWYEGWVYGGDKVLAWMPLPTPYKGGDSE